MTPTAEELTNSSSFWKSRMDQQMEYIKNFNDFKRSRPDKMEVFKSAMMIFERCQFFYLSAYVMEEIGGVFNESDVRKIFINHVAIWNSTSEYSKVVAWPKDGSNKGIIFSYV